MPQDTKNKAKKFKPTPKMICAAEDVFMAMAVLESVKEIVVAYQTEILRTNGWQIREGFGERMGRQGSVIRDPKDAFLMSDLDFQEYDRQCQLARRQAGLIVSEPSHCPLLEAEMALVQAKHALCDAMQPVTGLSRDDVLTMRIDKYQTYIELALKLLAPFVSAATIVSKATGGSQ